MRNNYFEVLPKEFLMDRAEEDALVSVISKLQNYLKVDDDGGIRGEYFSQFKDPKKRWLISSKTERILMIHDYLRLRWFAI